MSARNTLVTFFGLGSHTAVSLLYSYVAEHPQVCLPVHETHFFSDTTILARGVAWYESQFVPRRTRTVCGELAYEYLQNTQSAGLIARTYPNARLFAVIDNPLMSVRVEYADALQRRTISPQVSLAEFLNHNPEVLLRARYGRQLVQYFSFYAPTDLLVLLASDMRADVLKTVATTYKHLGLDAKFVPPTLRHLVVEEVDEKKKPGFIKRGFMALRSVLRVGYSYLVRKIKPKKVAVETAADLARKIPLTPELEAELREYFKTDVAQLSALLHRNLSVEWGFEEETTYS
jgi:hypothetical protein